MKVGPVAAPILLLVWHRLFRIWICSHHRLYILDGRWARVHPSFGMTTTKTLRSVFSWRMSISVMPMTEILSTLTVPSPSWGTTINSHKHSYYTIFCHVNVVTCDVHSCLYRLRLQSALQFLAQCILAFGTKQYIFKVRYSGDVIVMFSWFRDEITISQCFFKLNF